jgi:hypothetical protein
MVKRCKKCGKEFPATTEYFYKHKECKDGLFGNCKDCIKKNGKRYYENNREHRLELSREWNNKNEDIRKGNNKKWYNNNKEHCKQINSKLYVKNKEHYKEISKNWYENNRERKNETRNKWVSENKEFLKEYDRKYKSKKRSTDLMFRLNSTVSIAICLSLHGRKNGRHWEHLVGYNLEQLIKHLEKQFQPGMTLENHGRYGWHIDHKRPIDSFDFTSPEDEEFKQCWSLENLQPLWWQDNLSKSNKWETI